MPKDNLIIAMRRSQLPEINASHAGLLLDKGFYKWAKNEGKDASGRKVLQHNTATHELHIKASNIDCPEIYKKAYENWQKRHIENNIDKKYSKIWFGKLINRLYLGMGEASPLEAGITLHQTYGIPFIPGSAIKGVMHHYADEIGIPDDIKNMLFGINTQNNGKGNSGEAGYIIINDAWWIPEGKALAPEMITVHAQKYYSNKGKNFIHPDFESPNPNPQIAIQGSFMFCIEGDERLAEYAIELLKKAMTEIGIGGKVASGYGYFEETENSLAQKLFNNLTDNYTEELKQKQKAGEEAEKTEIYDNSPEHIKHILDLENDLEKYKEYSGQINQNLYSKYIGEINTSIDAIKNKAELYTDEEQTKIIALLNNIYETIGWYAPGKNKKQRAKQKAKKEEVIKQLFNNQD